MIGGLPRNSLMLMEFEDRGGVFELAPFMLAALELDFAELLDGLLELTREAGAVQAEAGDGGDQGLGAGDFGEQRGFEARDAVESPGCVDEILHELSFGCVGGLVFVDELAAVALVGGQVLGGEDGCACGESMTDCVKRRTLFAGGGAGAGGVLGICAINGGAVGGGGAGNRIGPDEGSGLH